ncbi:quinoprotein relay system zinc metallohydrolase 2 [Methylocystis parvus]|uniref:Quinoprotein relay system zinc metallohydrolase 2 n=1 Tax=Methylocystis parvus TaxID=134 RepID=A0A6B8M6G3_9HYPH|nr:quinoprotein relay system zinc metallohydrolase 2 [Methylocystis parvus]QGM96913.1 quinoprotein relay system zinc metallohydrolase 2 [Methylocystis parvus]WBJ99201.1 quinoprotein relay system zinc metallohydrolase 2 [Methylocystis parvus OBBP]
MLCRFLTLAAALAALPFFPAPGAAAPYFGLEEIAPGVYAHQGETSPMNRENLGGIANLGAIVGDDAVAVIDTGGSLLEGRAFLAALREKTQKPIRYVINTHAHPDHVFGDGAFAGDGVTFVGHKNLPRALSLRGEHYLAAFRQTMGDALDGVTIVAPTLTVSDSATLDLGGREIVLQAWKTAHSEADLTALDKKTGTLFAGDLLFLRHVPVVDGSLLGFLDVAEKLASVKAERVVPGHGPLVAPWPKALDDERAYLTRLTADLRAAIKKGESVKEAAAAAGSDERGKWALFEDYNIRNATAGFAELEWEEP